MVVDLASFPETGIEERVSNPPSVAIGVIGDSGSGMDMSSSKRDAVSSRNELPLAKDFLISGMSLFDFPTRAFSLSSPFVTPSIEGKPNSIASSNFWGEAR